MPMDRSKYPVDWDSIAHRIKCLADWTCEGCKKPCKRPSESHQTHKKTLTVAHINHTPMDCSDANLIALCAPCHLRYDAAMKKYRRLALKRGGKK